MSTFREDNWIFLEFGVASTDEVLAFDAFKSWEILYAALSAIQLQN